MPDSSEFAHLTALLISRQDQQQQQLTLLTSNLLKQDERPGKTDELLSRQAEQALKTGEVVRIFGQVQQQVIEQLELIYTEQQRFNQQQLAFNQRQDDFNIIFLEELRELKQDVREIRRDIKDLKDVVLIQHEERLRRLEDFMNGLRKAA